MDCRHHHKDLLYAGFNQDLSHVTVGTRSKFCVFTTRPLKPVYESSELGAAGCVEMLQRSSLLAVVGHGDQERLGPRTLALVGAVAGQAPRVLAEHTFVTCVCAVRITPKRLVVVLETKLHIFDTARARDPPLQTVDTGSNPLGLVAVSKASERCCIAYPVQTPGQLAVYDGVTLAMTNVIRAHTNPLAAVAMSEDGTLIATASQKGTVVRVYSALRAQRLASLRRGSYPATISCIAFAPDSSLLAVSSDTGTVHVFRLDCVGSVAISPVSPPPAPSRGWSILSPFSQPVSDMLENVRSIACARVGSASGAKSPPSLCGIDLETRTLHVLTADGYLHQYALDFSKPGADLPHTKSFSLFSH
eukprot:m51a1_g8722 putative autophagy protein 18 (361) ;mRNA; f:175335-176969